MPNHDEPFSSKFEEFRESAGDPVNAFDDPAEYARRALTEENFESQEIPILGGELQKPDFGEGKTEPTPAIPEYEPPSSPPEPEVGGIEIPEVEDSSPVLPIDLVDARDDAGDLERTIDPPPEYPEITRAVAEPAIPVEYDYQLEIPPIHEYADSEIKVPQIQPEKEGGGPYVPQDRNTGPWMGGPSSIPDLFPDMDNIAKEVGEQVRPDLIEMKNSVIYAAKDAIYRETMYQRMGEL